MMLDSRSQSSTDWSLWLEEGYLRHYSFWRCSADWPGCLSLVTVVIRNHLPVYLHVYHLSGHRLVAIIGQY